MVETVKQHCQHTDCMYRARSTLVETCDYMLVTGQPRNCDISICDKYKAGKKKVVSTLGGFIYDVDKDW